jgi:ABC-type multidrug transport system fused ATPase/permease subunit
MIGFQLMIAAIANGIFLPFLLTLANSKAAAARVQERIEKNKKYDGNTVPTELKGEVVFEKVEFYYPTKKDVQILKGVSFVAP